MPVLVGLYWHKDSWTRLLVVVVPQEALAKRTRPVGAFGQRFPQNVPAAASSAACGVPKPGAVSPGVGGWDGEQGGEDEEADEEEVVEDEEEDEDEEDEDEEEEEEERAREERRRGQQASTSAAARAAGGKVAGGRGHARGAGGGGGGGGGDPLRRVLVPEPDNRDGDRIEPDGLPAVGSIIWPGQVRLAASRRASDTRSFGYGWW